MCISNGTSYSAGGGAEKFGSRKLLCCLSLRKVHKFAGDFGRFLARCVHEGGVGSRLGRQAVRGVAVPQRKRKGLDKQQRHYFLRVPGVVATR